MDVKRSCKKLGIELLEGDYDFETWIDLVKGLEKEPEKGKRCEVCFDRRFDVSAHKAKELGETKMTTTLLVSPLKSQEQLKRVGDIFFKEHGVEFISPDYRSGGGSQDQSRVTKEEQLYRQDYCGCMFGLNIQREQQNKLADELFSPINGAYLDASIDQRLEFYEHRMDLDDKGVEYKVLKHKFLNYRLFNFKLFRGKKEILDAHLCNYSHLPRVKAVGRVELIHNEIGYFNRDEIRFISLEFYNEISNKKYKNIKDLIYSKNSQDDDKTIRNFLFSNNYDLTPIVVIEKLEEQKYTLFVDSRVYDDTKEHILML